MVRKVFSFVLSLGFIFFIYLFQLYIINSREIFGVKPNIILIACIVFTMFFGLYKGTISSFFIGFLNDMLFGTIGIFTVCYSLTSLVVGLVIKDNTKDDVLSVILVTIFATFCFEIFEYITYGVLYEVFSNVFYLLKQIIISLALNVVITFFVYKVIYKIIDIENSKKMRNYSGF